MLIIALLILAALLGGLFYYVSAQKQVRVSVQDNSDGTNSWPEEEVICGTVTGSDHETSLSDADGTAWLLISSARVSTAELTAHDGERICIMVHPADFPEDYQKHRLHVVAILENRNTQSEDQEADITDQTGGRQEELTCGLIDVTATGTIILRENDQTTWELLPEDGATENILRGREGVRSCIVFSPTDSADQSDLDQHKIHVISAAMIRDAGEEDL